MVPKRKASDFDFSVDDESRKKPRMSVDDDPAKPTHDVGQAENDKIGDEDYEFENKVTRSHTDAESSQGNHGNNDAALSHAQGSVANQGGIDPKPSRSPRLWEQLQFIVFTKENFETDPSDPSGTLSITTGPLTNQQLCDEYNKVYGANGTDAAPHAKNVVSEAVMKRYRKDKQDVYTAYPRHPQNIVYAAKAPKPKPVKKPTTAKKHVSNDTNVSKGSGSTGRTLGGKRKTNDTSDDEPEAKRPKPTDKLFTDIFRVDAVDEPDVENDPALQKIRAQVRLRLALQLEPEVIENTEAGELRQTIDDSTVENDPAVQQAKAKARRRRIRQLEQEKIDAAEAGDLDNYFDHPQGSKAFEQPDWVRLVLTDESCDGRLGTVAIRTEDLKTSRQYLNECKSSRVEEFWLYGTTLSAMRRYAQCISPKPVSRLPEWDIGLVFRKVCGHSAAVAQCKRINWDITTTIDLYELATQLQDDHVRNLVLDHWREMLGNLNAVDLNLDALIILFERTPSDDSIRNFWFKALWPNGINAEVDTRTDDSDAEPPMLIETSYIYTDDETFHHEYHRHQDNRPCHFRHGFVEQDYTNADFVVIAQRLMLSGRYSIRRTNRKSAAIAAGLRACFRRETASS
ncbi:hypothetical protein N0V90_011744 [Kalmusia sp. IMI 367209]|nr:hypothetical protein N0V90_011744 [Kalmusia sp. IMI 367209]